MPLCTAVESPIFTNAIIKILPKDTSTETNKCDDDDDDDDDDDGEERRNINFNM